MNDNYFKFSLSVFVFPLLFLLGIWVVYWYEIRFSNNLTDFGIYPRNFEGLRGVIFSPFLHGSLDHLYSNSIPSFLLIASLRYFYRDNFWQVLGLGVLVTGILTWIIGRESYHIGASGLIYALVSFIFFKGIRSQYYRLVALSLIIILVYGGMIWYVFPNVEEGISWEGHLAGLVTGAIMAVYIKTPDYKEKLQFEWQKSDYNPVGDKFMERFDENGNFVNPPKPVIIDEEEILQQNNNSTSFQKLKIIYHFKENES